jgi:hypothetical protein
MGDVMPLPRNQRIGYAVCSLNTLAPQIQTTSLESPLKRDEAVAHTCREAISCFRSFVQSILETFDTRTFGDEFYQTKVVEHWSGVNLRFSLVVALAGAIFNPDKGSDNVGKFMLKHFNSFQNPVGFDVIHAVEVEDNLSKDAQIEYWKAEAKKAVEKIGLLEERNAQAEVTAAQMQSTLQRRVELGDSNVIIYSTIPLNPGARASLAAAVSSELKVMKQKGEKVPDSIKADDPDGYAKFSITASKVNPVYLAHLKSRLEEILKKDSLLATDIEKIIPSSRAASFLPNPDLPEGEGNVSLPAVVNCTAKTSKIPGWGEGKISGVEFYKWLENIRATLPKGDIADDVV